MTWFVRILLFRPCVGGGVPEVTSLVTSLGSDPVFCFRCLECWESQKGTQLNSHQLSLCNAFNGDEQAAKSAIRVRPCFRFTIAFWSARVWNLRHGTATSNREFQCNLIYGDA